MTTASHPPNFRDAARGRLRRGFLFRSASPHLTVTAGEVDVLREAGITTYIDLRSDQERDAFGDGPLGDLGVEIVRVPLIGSLPDDVIERLKSTDEPRDPGESYVEQLEHVGGRMAEAVSAIAESGGPCLVTCTAGRDRTGMVVAVTLLAIGATPEEIVDDYITTDTEIERIQERMATGPTPEFLQRVLPRQGTHRCRPEHMQAVLGWLERQGGAAGYLADHGATPAVLERLQGQFIADATVAD